MKIEKESDTLRREYRNLVREIERLTNSKHSHDYITSRIDQIFQRQQQIVKELEECTGIQITVKTEKEILEENKRIQYGDNEGSSSSDTNLF